MSHKRASSAAEVKASKERDGPGFAVDEKTVGKRNSFSVTLDNLVTNSKSFSC